MFSSVMTMQTDAYLKCIDPKCGLEYPIESTNVQCEKGHMLDVKYKNKPSESLKDVFYQRRNSQPEGARHFNYILYPPNGVG